MGDPDTTPSGTDGNRTEGAPRFLVRGSNALAAPAQALAIGDLNADGMPDLVVASAGMNATMGGAVVSVFANAGGGAFAARADYRVDAGAGSLALGDLTGDGRPEILVGGDGGGLVGMLLNLGDGRFDAFALCACGGLYPTVRAGDIDGNGTTDIVVANRRSGDLDASGSLVVLLNDGDGQFTRPPDRGTTATELHALALGDLNGDGRIDVATGGPCGGGLLLNTGGGRLADAVRYETLVGDLVLGDFDGDGDADIVATGRSRWAVDLLLNDGHGVLGAPLAIGIRDAGHTTIGDVNGDGRADLVFATTSAGHKLSVLLNEGGGGRIAFGRALNYALLHPTSFEALAIADIDGDGKNDVAAAGGTSVIVFLNVTD